MQSRLWYYCTDRRGFGGCSGEPLRVMIYCTLPSLFKIAIFTVFGVGGNSTFQSFFQTLREIHIRIRSRWENAKNPYFSGYRGYLYTLLKRTRKQSTWPDFAVNIQKLECVTPKIFGNFGAMTRSRRKFFDLSSACRVKLITFAHPSDQFD